MNDTVTIAKGEYLKLLERRGFMDCLESLEIEEWSRYGDAKEMMGIRELFIEVKAP